MEMDFTFVQDRELFSLAIIPILIFSVRVADVTFGTLRIIFVSRGLKLFAPFVAFFEILIWLVAIGQIFLNLGSVVNYIAYAAGFGVGNFVGIIVEGRMAIGLNMIWIITQFGADDLIPALKSLGFGVAVVDAAGKHGPLKLIFLVVKRKDIRSVIIMGSFTLPFHRYELHQN